eukprot:CAMPEP_0197929508 /NCGR_PEP_ID=MMETSP1439-20131203/103922_1 /TAXON_ID=66791 /ORGANISM="Gonyaulax spinifera, Strain CCMP409" /LENGTH=146 /DNA_ID=CAMNT_0043552155 /DNA_START=179 /DNA_END=616 /DNA_ORIENTATION=-
MTGSLPIVLFIQYLGSTMPTSAWRRATSDSLPLSNATDPAADRAELERGREDAGDLSLASCRELVPAGSSCRGRVSRDLPAGTDVDRPSSSIRCRIQRAIHFRSFSIPSWNAVLTMAAAWRPRLLGPWTEGAPRPPGMGGAELCSV